MGWSVGYDSNWHRDVGYGVPATCDQPNCGTPIDRGLAYVCGSDVFGGERGCGLFFCHDHLRYVDLDEEDPTEERYRSVKVCDRCEARGEPYSPTPDTHEWMRWKLTEPSWQVWRETHPYHVAAIKIELGEIDVE